MKRVDIGLVGGGQLGRMMLLEGHRIGLTFAVLDPSSECPAAVMTQELIQAAFTDAAAIERLADRSRRLTYEFEHIDAGTLMHLASTGCRVMPSPETLHMVQDKFRQKTFLASCHLPVPAFRRITSEQDLREASLIFDFPFLLKSCTGGYDGKGNALIVNSDGIKDAFLTLGGEGTALMAEEGVDFLMEISVLAARDEAGRVELFTVGQNIHRNNILHRTIVPAPLPENVIEEAEHLAKETMRQLKGTGIFCIEMFVDRRFRLLINEIAPRTHNSGHHTIESCNISQFGQQLRALMGWPLMKPVLRRPAVMINLLGDPKGSGYHRLTGIDEAMKFGEVYPHLYGKAESRPGRKMGHVTILADTVEEALEIADKVEGCLKVEVFPEKEAMK